MKLTSDIIKIVQTGVNVKISGKKLTSDIIQIVKEAKKVGTNITIVDAGKKLTSDLISISKIYPEGITLELDT